MPASLLLVPFQSTLRVGAADIDEQGHVNNVTYLRWVQDVATAHWRAAVSKESQDAILWVVLRHEIDYKAPALLGDELVIETCIGEVIGLTFERHVRIMRASDGKLLVQARTLWCPLNPQTGRPQRISPELRAVFSARESE